MKTTGQQAVNSAGKRGRSTAGQRTTEEFLQTAHMDKCESDDDEHDSVVSETEDDTAEQVHICVNMANRLDFTGSGETKNVHYVATMKNILHYFNPE